MPRVNIVTVKKRGDDVTITGIIEGIEVQAHVWFSALSQLPDNPSRKQAIAKALKNALPPVDQDLTDTYKGEVDVP